jgi:hypothetical protein
MAPVWLPTETGPLGEFTDDYLAKGTGTRRRRARDRVAAFANVAPAFDI